MDSEKARRITMLAEKQRKSLAIGRQDEADAQEEAKEEALAQALSTEAISYDFKDTSQRRQMGVPRWLRPCYNTCYNKTFRRLRKQLKPLVRNMYFDIASTLTILISAIIMGIEAEIWDPNDGSTPKPVWIDLCMWIINVSFLVEWVLRFIVGGALWLKEPLNIMFTLAVFAPFFFAALGDTVEIVRIVVRMLRIGKVIHTIKNVKGFKVIWLLLSGLFASAGTLFWSCLLLATSVLFFSIIAVDLIGYAEVWTYQPEDAIPRWFVSIRSAMFTMSRFMSSDGAMDIVEYLMQVPWAKDPSNPYPNDGQPYIWIFLFAFQALSQYVILNLVTAVICDNSMKIVSEDEANRAEEAEKEKQKQIEELRELFKLLDSDGSGEVDTAEFDGAFEIPALKNKLLLLGLEESELKRFFRALDSDGSGSMGIDEFCEGIPELFGQATAFSMLKAKKKAEKAEKQLRRLKDKLGHPPDRLTTIEPPKSAGELELQDDIRNLQVEVETRLAKLDETVKTSLKHVERIGEVLGTL
ncbi:NaCP60E [Symbiodinium sp. CCMP2592]|nr:NaCP60E [Symbiodinium sp. CCMP2592]